MSLAKIINLAWRLEAEELSKTKGNREKIALWGMPDEDEKISEKTPWFKTNWTRSTRWECSQEAHEAHTKKILRTNIILIKNDRTIEAFGEDDINGINLTLKAERLKNISSKDKFAGT